MIIINYQGGYVNLSKAVETANKLFGDRDFLKSVSSHKDDFDSANINGEKLSELISSSNLRMEIVYYRTFFPSRAYAYFDPSKPTVIHLNKRHLGRAVASLCNTLVHETIHAVDAQHSAFEFGHGDNSSAGKEHSAPYWVGNLVEQLISGDKSVKDLTPENEASEIDFSSIEVPYVGEPIEK